MRWLSSINTKKERPVPMETELKFEVDDAAAERLSQRLGLAKKGKTVSLRSVYFDTPDADLNAWGMALRVREEAGRFVQTVKTTAPGARLHRGEWEAQVRGPGLDLEAAELTPLRQALNGCGPEALRPVFETRIERAARRLRVDGGLIEAALDRGTVGDGARQAPVLELELELKRGPIEALFKLARELADVAPMNLSFSSKAARGFALLDGEPLAPVRAADPTLSRDDTAGSAFKAIAGSGLAQMTDNARVLRHIRRIEALHQLRVGARRLRSAISLFRPMLADDQVDEISGELRWLTRELDDARNLDVFITETFRPAAKRHARSMGLSNLGRALITAQTRAYDRAEAALGSERCRALMLETAAWIETGPWTVSDDPTLVALRERPIKPVARAILRDRRRMILKKGARLAALAPQPRHKLRINAKKLRYACGFFSGLFGGKPGKRLKRFVAAMEDLQDGLGALTDIVAADSLTAELATAATTEAPEKLAFAAGLIAGERQTDEATATRAAEKAFQRFAKAEPFW
jgi:triphosphatase